MQTKLGGGPYESQGAGPGREETEPGEERPTEGPPGPLAEPLSGVLGAQAAGKSTPSWCDCPVHCNSGLASKLLLLGW